MQNNNITIRQARLQGHEGLWQITIENGRFSRIEPQEAASLPQGEVLDAEGGLAIPPFVEPHIHWIPRKRRVNRAGTSPAHCLKGLSAGQNVKQCSRMKM